MPERLDQMSDEQLLEKFGFSLSDLKIAEETQQEDLGPTGSEGEEEVSEEVVTEAQEEPQEEPEEATAEAEAQEEPEEETTEEQEGEEKAEDLLPEEMMNKTVVLKDGTKVSVEELTKGYLRQADYTRKTQRLAEERKQVENQRRELEMAVERFGAITEQAYEKIWFSAAVESAVRANPWLAEVIGSILKGDPKKAAEVMTQRVDDFRTFTLPEFPDASQVSPADEEARVRELAERLRSEWEEIVAEDPEADLDEVVRVMRESGLTSLKAAYKLAYMDRLIKRAEEAGYRKAIAEAKKGLKPSASPKRTAARSQVTKPPEWEKMTPSERAAYLYRYGKL